MTEMVGMTGTENAFALASSTPLQFALIATTSLITTVNPVSAAPLFVSMTGGELAPSRKRTAKKACLAALVILNVFAGAGTILFKFFGITTPAFQITGGLLFVLMSVRALLGNGREIDDAGLEGSDPSVVPLAIPILSGPGAITTVVVLSGQATTAAGKAIVAMAIVVTIAITYVILRSAPRVVESIGVEGRRATEKILALLTGVIGMQFILNGATPVFVGILRAAGR